ncbi:MAG: hypothetical protein C0404_10305 [Verrucomicrobia bacterium]|nr:hypothetical protein [Verrucomicrobiota bacterium]
MKIKGTQILIAYGPLLVASFYATWLAGRVSLGYWPRASLDDPKGIVGFWMWTYDATALLLLAGLPVVGALAAMSLFRPLRDGSPEWKRRLVEASVGTVLILFAVGFLRWDPHHVVEWYFD